MIKWLNIGVFLLLSAGVAIGILYSSRYYPDTFWPSFFPNLWATVIGVSLAALVGIPVGFAASRYVMQLTARHNQEHQRKQTRELLEQVEQEVRSHAGALQALSGRFWAPSAQTASDAPGGPPAPQIGSFLLQDIFGRQFLSSRAPLELGESLITFQVGNYYARVWDLNRLLTWRIQTTENPEQWDQSIQGVLQVTSATQSQVDFEIRKAIERMGAGATLRN